MPSTCVWLTDSHARTTHTRAHNVTHTPHAPVARAARTSALRTGKAGTPPRKCSCPGAAREHSEHMRTRQRDCSAPRATHKRNMTAANLTVSDNLVAQRVSDQHASQRLLSLCGTHTTHTSHDTCRISMHTWIACKVGMRRRSVEVGGDLGTSARRLVAALRARAGGGRRQFDNNTTIIAQYRYVTKHDYFHTYQMKQSSKLLRIAFAQRSCKKNSAVKQQHTRTHCVHAPLNSVHTTDRISLGHPRRDRRKRG
jgi:hypothetical protein